MVEQKKKEQLQEAKSKALELALSQIEKQFGKGSIMRLGQNIKVDVAVISTGALSVDLALGIGACRGAELWKYLGRRPAVRLP